MAKSDAASTGDAARAERKARLMSVIATVGFVAIIGSCCVCGGMVFYKRPHFVSDRETAVAVTSEILPVRVPEGYSPQGAIRWDLWMLLKMQGAYYTLDNGEGELSFLEVDSRFIDNAQFRAHILKSLREHGAGGGFDLAVHSAETRTFEIDGRSVPFSFLEAEDRTSGSKRRLVDGIVDGMNGPVMISLWVDEEHWNPQQIEQLLASIGGREPVAP
jgi:hypothetical protein